MSDNKQHLYARNLICICVDDTENGDYQGQIWQQYSDEAIDFDGILQMLTLIDGLLDEWDFPQEALSSRAFYRKDKSEHKAYNKKAGPDELVIDRVQKENGTRNVQNKRGKKATFIVQVSFRQRATWQGHVIHAESDEKKDFLSEMELLRIMDSYIRM